MLMVNTIHHTQFKYGLVTKNVKFLLAFEMCANERFFMEGPRWGNFNNQSNHDLVWMWQLAQCLLFSAILLKYLALDTQHDAPSSHYPDTWLTSSSSTSAIWWPKEEQLTSEPEHVKTNRMTCATSDDSAQPSLIRVFTVHFLGI